MSNSDKRSVSTDALETLGSIIGPNEKRDAIHLAVYPVVAECDLDPGEDVGLLENGNASVHAKEKVGIVDPFLRKVVKSGERFWLVIYPRQIKSLRHVWEHPAFPASGETETARASGSEQWLRDLAERVGMSYGRLMGGAADFIAQTEGGVQWPDRLTGGSEMEGESTPDDFWIHYENVTGKKVAEEHRTNFFSCSC